MKVPIGANRSAAFFFFFFEKVNNGLLSAEENLEPCGTSMVELFAKIVKGWKVQTIFAISTILDVYRDSEYPLKHSNKEYNT